MIVFFVLSAPLFSQFSPAATSSQMPATTKASSPPNLPPLQSFALASGYFQNFEVDSFSNNTWVAYKMISNVTISTALMTSSQFSAFNNSASDEISNSIIYQNGTSDQEYLGIGPGQYFLVFYAYSTDANVSFSYAAYPNTPFSYGAVLSPLASGISSFGIYNNSGVVTPYEIRTNEIVGVANISAFQVDTPNAASFGDHVTGATLQLNALLVVTDNGSSAQKVYWAQNVPDFVTAASQVSIGDEIWNNTDLTGYMSNQTVTSPNFQNGGFVYPSGAGNSSGSQYLYAYSLNNASYNLPLNFGLLVNETTLPHTGVMVQFGYRVLSNGSATNSATNWFDNVTIHDPNVQTWYFDVSGNSTTPVGNYFDAELVFAGEGNLESAYFTQLTQLSDCFIRTGQAEFYLHFRHTTVSVETPGKRPTISL